MYGNVDDMIIEINHLVDFSDYEPKQKVRKCKICGKPLSIYNLGNECFHHDGIGFVFNTYE